jgi:predicted dehydrogenase
VSLLWTVARLPPIVVDGGIGELRTIQSFFSFWNTDPADIRNIPQMGGGALMDIGCYSISLARFLFGAEPLRALGIMEYDPKFGTDSLTSGVLDFGNGSTTFTCSTQLASFQRVNILGTEGRIEVLVPFNPDPNKPSKILYFHGNETSEITFEPCDQYTIQGDEFSLAVLEKTNLPTPLEDAVSNMRVLECIIQSAHSGGWITC